MLSLLPIGLLRVSTPIPMRVCRSALAAALAVALGVPPAPTAAETLQWRRGAAAGNDSLDAAPGDRFIGPAPTGSARQAAYITDTPAAKRPRRVASTHRKQPHRGPGTTPTDFESAVEQALADRGAGASPAVDPSLAPVGFFHRGPLYAHGVAGCGSAPGCAIADPGCGIAEPACGLAEPGCGVGAPDCGCVGPTCSCGAAGCECGDAACCGDCVGGWKGCGGVIPLYIYLPPIEEIVLFGGVQGFKGPLDSNPMTRDAGNFGFRQGINAGGRMIWLPIPGLGYQIGYAATQNQLSGDSLTGRDAHTQQFVTAGLFRRAPVGWQYGVVYDLLQDERQASTDFSQVRGQLSFLDQSGRELGFEFAARTNEERINNRLFQAADQYRLFYRQRGRSGGEFKGFLGSSSDNHVLLGGELFAPLDHRWSIRTGFTYFIPTDSGDGRINDAGTGLIGGVPGVGVTAPGGSANEEAWNVGINLVWHYGARGKRWYSTPWRPLFDVADNGSFVLDDDD